MEPLLTRTPSLLPILVSSLPAWPDVGVLRRAARSGATPILNLEAVSPESARTALSALIAHTTPPVGIRLGSEHSIAALTEAGHFDLVVLAASRLSDAATVAAVIAMGAQLIVECTSAADARSAESAGAHALIAKGHETGGHVGDETSFVLVQRLIATTTLPVYAHGGVGRHTIGAFLVAGCAGVVLDVQMALARESTLPARVKDVLRRFGGDETVCVGQDLGDPYRLYRRPGSSPLQELKRLETELGQLAWEGSEAGARTRWREELRNRVRWSGNGVSVWPLGQDAAFARPLAERYRSVSGILSGLSDACRDHVELAQRLRPLDRGAPLAIAHRTAYPIVQGPMTRVSDEPAFAERVARDGGLPFLALALLRGPRVRSLLAETKALLGDRAWGVGILGFVPAELRAEQLEAIEEFAPPFALIAGGRPDQAVKLEQRGIPTYLHVPAPSLLRTFLSDGARRFVFEGRECGGHVGPRTSLVLWESVIDTLLAAVEGGIEASDLHVVFAGGIHDARSAAMVATIAAPLAQLGVRVGVLMGTAYLFTEEAVSTGAIVRGFQAEALKCATTVLLETGPGHSTRCAETPFVELFRRTKTELAACGAEPDDVRMTLEQLNLGRLRVASKGRMRGDAAADGATEPATYVSVDEARQLAEGLFMLGQVAALRRDTCRIAELHHDVSVGGSALLAGIRLPAGLETSVPASALSCHVAIVGVGCFLPQALTPQTLWRNILQKTDAIGEVPLDRFDIERYFDADRHARDKVYSRWGGFLGDVPFDPVKFGIPPAAVPSIDPFQLLTLEVVSQAIDDAGYTDRPFNRERTSVILGASGGAGELGLQYSIRSALPNYLEAVDELTLARLPEWTEDSFAGVLLNVAAGRVANRLNLGGLNFTVDAACASSLAAVYIAARELESRGTDMVIVGGFDTSNSPFGYHCFSSAQALSPTGRCRTFDESADGIAISEGLVALVLKRVADAERDGDRIYAVIRSAAGSSDGRGKGLMAPKPEGQMRVLERAYAAAGFSPATVGLVEAHGTGTVAGDTAEVTALSRVFSAAGSPPASCAIGSIKSMIGHTKSTAGVSGLLKVALALHHKVVPPTLHVTKPNTKLSEGGNPFFVPTEPLPWLAPLDPELPRRAAVSSFGFGGTNFHVVVEEYDRSSPDAWGDVAPVETWPAEVAYWTSPNSERLLETLRLFESRVALAPDVSLSSVASAVCRGASTASASGLRLAIVASSSTDLRRKVATVCDALASGNTQIADPNGVYLSQGAAQGKVAFLFPGQGSQYPGMHRDLAVHFPDLRHAIEVADRVTAGQYARRLSAFILPPTPFSSERAQEQQRELTDTSVAQPALGAVEHGLCHLLERLGVRPDMTGGHSYGEYTALAVAGAFSFETLVTLSAARGLAIKHAAEGHAGTMVAVSASPEAIGEAIGHPPDVWIANVNSPRQTVLAGGVDALDAVLERLSQAKLSARRIPVACAFHSPLIASAGRVMSEALERTDLQVPAIPVFSNTLAEPYPSDVSAIRKTLSDHLTAPVRFADQVRAMYREGARTFVEVGPRAVLSHLVRETLAGQRPLVLALDAAERDGVTQLLHVVAQLAVAGVPINFDELWRGRDVAPVTLSTLPATKPLPAHVWLVNGGRATPQGKASVDGRSSRTSTTQSKPAVSTSATVLPPTSIVPHASRLRSGDTPPPLQGRDMSDSVPDSSTAVSSSPHVLDAAAADLMSQFQQLMSQFLQTQALVMTTYLQGTPAAGLATSQPAFTPRTMPQRREPSLVVAPTVAAPVFTALPTNGSQRHSGAAVASPVQAAPTQSVTAPILAATNHGQPPRPSTAARSVLDQLLDLVSERTGYPLDMLSVDAHIEADLGIDSIKRMEILTAFQQLHATDEPGSFQGAMERLTAIKTLRETATVLEELLVSRTEVADARVTA